MTEYKLAKEDAMRWIGGLALIVAILALSLEVVRSSADQSAGRYQIVRSMDGSVVRLDTKTGEMVAFDIAPRAQWESAKASAAKYGRFEFLELARSAKAAQP